MKTIFKMQSPLALLLAFLPACATGVQPSESGAESGGTSSGGKSAAAGTAGTPSGNAGGKGSMGGSGAGLDGSGGSGASAASGATAGGEGGCEASGCGNAGAGAGPTQEPGTWIDVTPSGLDLSGEWLTGASPSGVQNVVVDPAVPSNVYLFFYAYGIFKSTDYGMTYTKISTGENSDKINAGCPWSVSMDMNPNRDPNTPPTFYINAGFGAGGLWKTTDGGTNFAQVFQDNVYASDGVTNIWSHVGGDVANAFLIESTNTDHLVLFMHGQPDSDPQYRGLFETTNGGVTWILHQSDLFTFAPHSDGFAPIDPNIWIVAAGTLSPGEYMFRSTDAGASWSPVSGTLAKGMAGGVEAISFQWARAGSAIYTESTGNGVFKTTDQGTSWVSVPGSGMSNQWVVTTKKNVYTTNGNPWDPNPTFYHAPLDADTAWVSEPFPAGMIENGVRAAVTFDGTHSVIIAAQHKAGAWRYVEP